MSATFPLTLALTGFTIAALHAAVPTHWLPFVLVGRARNWPARRILCAVLLAGGGHVAVTAALGIGLAFGGFELGHHVGEALHWLIAGVLVTLGLWLVVRPACRACGHVHAGGAHPVPATKGSDRAALAGLFLALTLSPCELFLPVYLTAVPHGWPAVAILSAVLAAGTLGGMLLLTALTLAGGERWARPGSRWQSPRLLGGCLCLLGFATLAVSHH
ncbi:MAG: hypothetical protein ABII82_11965 [Verrucomicrobiota bacterium]